MNVFIVNVGGLSIMGMLIILYPAIALAGDVDASCDFNGLDITYGVNYFKGGDAPQPCPECPPAL